MAKKTEDRVETPDTQDTSDVNFQFDIDDGAVHGLKGGGKDSFGFRHGSVNWLIMQCVPVGTPITLTSLLEAVGGKPKDGVKTATWYSDTVKDCIPGLYQAMLEKKETRLLKWGPQLGYILRLFGMDAKRSTAWDAIKDRVKRAFDDKGNLVAVKRMS